MSNPADDAMINGGVILYEYQVPEQKLRNSELTLQPTLPTHVGNLAEKLAILACDH